MVGLLAVELFLTTDGRVLVNELAPRPHNTYHASERACATSQFEQLVRAVCGLPLGAPTLLCAGAIANLLGDLWVTDEQPDPAGALEIATSRAAPLRQARGARGPEDGPPQRRRTQQRRSGRARARRVRSIPAVRCPPLERLQITEREVPAAELRAAERSRARGPQLAARSPSA